MHTVGSCELYSRACNGGARRRGPEATAPHRIERFHAFQKQGSVMYQKVTRRIVPSHYHILGFGDIYTALFWDYFGTDSWVVPMLGFADTALPYFGIWDIMLLYFGTSS